MSEKNECKHCHMDIEIRNPSGFCDHLYYPDCCEVCKAANPSELDRLRDESAQLREDYLLRIEQLASQSLLIEKWREAFEKIMTLSRARYNGDCPSESYSVAKEALALGIAVMIHGCCADTKRPVIGQDGWFYRSPQSEKKEG